MVDIDKLIFRREHFPIVLDEVTGMDGRKFWDFPRIEIPPYHPSMRTEGIDFHSVPSFLDEVVEWTVKDLEEIAGKRRDIQAILQDIVKDKKTGRVLFDPRIVEKDDLGITIEAVPIISYFCVGKDGMNPYGTYYGDAGIWINPEVASPSFAVPKSVVFSPELMKEYEMEDDGVFFRETRRFVCPNVWYRHNLSTINAIFYKNLVTALDNAVVRKKYR